MNELSLVIIVVSIAFIIVQRAWYTAKMHRLGALVIGEAYRVREGWPDYYPAYRHRAIASLESHGCADLISSLPEPAPGNQP